MTDEEKKAVEDLKLFLDKKENYLTDKELQIVLNLIQKQEKVIDKMVKHIDENTYIDEVDCV